MNYPRFGSSPGEDLMPQSFSTMIDRFFNESVNSRKKATDFTPHADVCEIESGFEIEIALPGLQKENINLEFQEGRLTVTGERRLEKNHPDCRYHIIESPYGAFIRSFQLPENIDPNAISAEFKDGILKIAVPKNSKKAIKLQVHINSSEKSTVNQIAEEQDRSLPEEPQGAVAVGVKKRKTKKSQSYS